MKLNLLLPQMQLLASEGIITSGTMKNHPPKGDFQLHHKVPGLDDEAPQI